MIMFVPHFGVLGGAGKYISVLASKLVERGVVLSFFGVYKDQYKYECADYTFAFEWFVSKFVLPSYYGVGNSVRFFYFIRLLLLLFFLPFFKLIFRKSSGPEYFVLTSIIQAPLLCVFAFLFPRARLVILIQENFILDGFFGFLNLIFLKKANIIVCIDSNSKNRLYHHGFESILLSNPFFDDVVEDTSDDLFSLGDQVYDAIYVGGDGEIKGFSLLLKLFHRVSRERNIKILMLGYYSERSLALIHNANQNALEGSVLKVLGYVDSCMKYYGKSKLLLLPISAAHFCRPAIEAGLLRKPFLVSDLDGLDDFAIPDFNCKVFTCQDEQSFYDEFIKLIDDPDLLSFLGSNNYKFSLEFKSKFYIDDFICKLEV